MYQKYKSKVVFLIVYILEAHAKDEWPSGTKLSFMDQPKTIERRCELAKMVEQKMSLPVLVDSIDNSFETQFACWPFRFYGLTFQNGECTLSLKPQPILEPYITFEVTDLEKWIMKQF